MSSDSESSEEDPYDRWRASALAEACEWCLIYHGGGICGRGRECSHMASFSEAQTRERLSYTCKNAVLPPHASLQSRIVRLVESRS